jgi:predicted SnoaL-like aldol condensation-catalyzing enzyme
MKSLLSLILIVFMNMDLLAQSDTVSVTNQIEINKQIVNGFYQDLWFTNNTDNYAEYVADEYVAHDIGDRKSSLEPAVEQKNIADRFWKHTTNWSTSVDFQIAEGDLVATRWRMTAEPKTLIGRLVVGKNDELPIINVMRIEDGKIVEFWNHRHDIDTRMARLPLILRGLAFGLVIALIPTFIAFRQRRTVKNLREKSETEHEA